MLPGTKDLAIYQGDTFILRLRLKLSTARNVNDYIDLTGCSVVAQIRSTEDSNTIIAPFTTVVENQTTNKGEVTISLANTTTTAMTQDGLYDVQVTFPDGTVTTYLRGKVTLTKEVTR